MVGKSKKNRVTDKESKDFFNDTFSFYSTGIYQGTKKEQLGEFTREQLSLHHIRQIKQKLGISGVQSDICGWKGDGAQIDLLIDRRDQTINLCETKFSQGEFEITKQYDERLRERAEIFRSTTKTRKAIHQTFVTTYGLKKNMYSGTVQSEVVLDDLFLE